MYSFDKTLEDGRMVSVCIPRMSHLRANITYICDRKCPNCNRACGVAPSNVSENMSLDDFRKVMSDSLSIGKHWTKIVLTGGEPSLHPEFYGFAEAAVAYKKEIKSECHVWVGTYHHPLHFKRIQSAIDKLPELEIMGTPKTTPRVHSYATYMAPMDSPSMPANHFYRGCHLVGSLCGTTVDYQGFWCCPVAPAIARVFNLPNLVKKMKDVSLDSLTAQYDQSCRRCGFYKMEHVGNRGEPKSASWEKALKEYKATRTIGNPTKAPRLS